MDMIGFVIILIAFALGVTLTFLAGELFFAWKQRKRRKLSDQAKQKVTFSKEALIEMLEKRIDYLQTIPTA